LFVCTQSLQKMEQSTTPQEMTVDKRINLRNKTGNINNNNNNNNNSTLRVAVGLSSRLVSVHRLTTHMSVSVTRQSQAMDTTVCLVALALVAIHGTTRSTICCVVPLSTTRESHSLCTRDKKRLDGVTQVPWKRGQCIAWDATCPDTFAQSYVQTTVSLGSIWVGSVVASAKEKNIRVSHFVGCEQT